MMLLFDLTIRPTEIKMPEMRGMDKTEKTEAPPTLVLIPGGTHTVADLKLAAKNLSECPTLASLKLTPEDQHDVGLMQNALNLPGKYPELLGA